MRRLILLAAVLALLPVAAAQARTSLVEVPLRSSADAGHLEALGLDVTEDVRPRAARVMLHSDAERRTLASAGFAATELVHDVDARSLATREQDAGAARVAAPSPLPSGRNDYRYLDDYAAGLTQLAADHPSLVRRVDLPGRSAQGRQLAGVEITADVDHEDEDGRPAYVVIGLTHAREWPSGEVAMEFADDLAQHAGTDPRIAALLQRVRVFVFPVINPDGFVLSRGTAPALVGPVPNQRKNADEVDLNRNFGAFWGGNGASTLLSSDTYRGSGPWSEPESAALHLFSQRQQITGVQSLHNISALVLRPPGFRALGLAPDEPALKDLGDRMAAATGYSSQYGYELYEVTGAAEDWNYVAQNAFAYTIELGPSGATDFHGDFQTHVVDQYLGPDDRLDGGNGVREALLLAGEQAGDPRFHAVLRGTAPPGSVLRLRKTFTTSTSPVCQIPYDGGSATCASTAPAQQLDDAIDTRLTVPASGRYVWQVDPSTRPFVRKAGGTEAWTLSCETPLGAQLASRSLVIGLGEAAEVDPCTPEPAGGPARGGAVQPPRVAPARALTLSLRLDRRQRRATVLRRGLLVRATCSVDCRLGASVRRASAARVLGSRTLALRAGRAVAFRVRPGASGRRTLARLSRVVVRLEARAGGTRRVQARQVRLTR